MEKSKLIIGGVIVVAIIGITAFMILKQPEAPVVKNESIKDLTISSDFCSEVITRSQLREIIGYQGEFDFYEQKGEDPIFGVMRMCSAFAEEIRKGAVGISISDLSYEMVMQKIMKDPDLEEAILQKANKLDNVGEEAIIMSGAGIYLIKFSDRDINKFVQVVAQGGFTQEVAVELARQVEANIK